MRCAVTQCKRTDAVNGLGSGQDRDYGPEPLCRLSKTDHTPYGSGSVGSIQLLDRGLQAATEPGRRFAAMSRKAARSREFRRPAPACKAEASVLETGTRNGAFGADKFGFNDLKALHWNLTEPRLYEL